MNEFTRNPPPGHLPSVQYVKGIGPKRAAVLEEMGITTVMHLFMYVPRRYLDRSSVVTIARLKRIVHGDVEEGLTRAGEDPTPDTRQDHTVVGEVRSFRVVGFGPKSRLILVLADATGSMQCIWFGGVQYWKKAFTLGETLAVSGQGSMYGGSLQFVHPDIDRIARNFESGDDVAGGEGIDWSSTLHSGGLVPVYPSSQELSRVGFDSAGFRRVLHSAIRDHLKNVVDTLPAPVMSRRSLLPLDQAIRKVHFPPTREDLHQGLHRLKYEELFRFQVKLALKRHWQKEEIQGISFSVESRLARRLVDSLPFSLTAAQVGVINEVSADMKSVRPMNRLLQGDVGSGKTIVALTSMLIAVENGYQAVFMAPTEILVEQHYKTLAHFLEGLPVRIRLLVGAQRTALRREILEDVHRGSADIVVGTHALFEKEVRFSRLGLVIIDEQHRFGVLQRSLLRKKGTNPDVLIMTATPIPRTLSLTLYGDLDVSTINELPRDRRPVQTILRGEGQKESAYSFVREQVGNGRQAYFVYPLIEESEKLDLKAATSHFEELRSIVFPDLRLGLLHGRMTGDQKDQVMEKFRRHELDLLVATTVIEVGIDIPNATVMVIENAERFGLSQLHQLRGRVGRGSEQSYCILLAKWWAVAGASRRPDPVAQQQEDQRRVAQRRLATMVATNDGFAIAEVDLSLRGPGDFFGTRQSGLPEFRVANILTDSSLLHDARTDALALVESDPHLTRDEHRRLADDLRSRFHDELAILQVG
jgi:ATP-dependent DNA helicase RecG